MINQTETAPATSQVRHLHAANWQHVDTEAQKFGSIVEFWTNETLFLNRIQPMVDEIQKEILQRRANIRAFREQLMQYQAIKEGIKLPE
jgi:hypothetical protein